MPPIIEDVHRPQSMPTGPRNVLRSNDSASLWNCTLSPGWSEEENEILRKALMKFGIGNWAKIIESECLPGKTNAQMNLQLQRMLGQQSTAENETILRSYNVHLEFGGLHIDPLVIGEKNAKIQGPHIKRKNNCIVNTGARPLREEIKARIAKNKALIYLTFTRYEVPEEVWSKIELPKPQDVVLETKREELRRLEEELRTVQEQINLARNKPLVPETIANIEDKVISSVTSVSEIEATKGRETLEKKEKRKDSTKKINTTKNILFAKSKLKKEGVSSKGNATKDVFIDNKRKKPQLTVSNKSIKKQRRK
ncbi:hypothetical protein G9A89_006737 [Geosiphon pyriformis]|nr:hypothetical protein G9A89_006737 [Geosiphon pyriformis]